MSLSKDDARAVAKALGVNDRQPGGGLPPATSRGGIPSQTGTGISPPAGGGGMSFSKLTEQSREYYPAASTPAYTADGLFAITPKPIKSMKCKTDGNDEVTLEFKQP